MLLVFGYPTCRIFIYYGGKRIAHGSLWFLCLMAYLSSWVIYCLSHSYKRTVVVLYKFIAEIDIGLKCVL